MNNIERNDLSEVLKQQRMVMSLTLHELATMSGVSASHLSRIEKGKRFPSAHILRKIAKPLGFEEDELFTLAGYLSPQLPSIAEAKPDYSGGRLTSYAAKVLAEEPVEVQHAVIGILSIIKSIARSIAKENR